jgi:Transaldolase/Fructose-6-phosphate aldolase
MRATRVLYDLGQSLWLDNITRDMLTSGTLKKYIDTLSVTGLTSNPTIFDHAISLSNAYDSEIRRLVGRGLSGETLFFELAIQDLTQAAVSARVRQVAARGFPARQKAFCLQCALLSGYSATPWFAGLVLCLGFRFAVPGSTVLRQMNRTGLSATT